MLGLEPYYTHQIIELPEIPPNVTHFVLFKGACPEYCLLADGREEEEARKFVRRLKSEMETLWLFLKQEGVSATNNHAERLLRFAVLWRKSSLGTASEKGDRWVECIPSLGQTCRMRRMGAFPVLVDAARSSFTGKAPDVAWI
jgi:transposase